MTEPRTIRGPRTLPDIQALGFRWKALGKVLDKQQRIWTESREIDAQFQAAEAEVAELERRALGEMTTGILSGEEVREAADALPEARERVEDLRRRGVAYAAALERLQREIAEHVEEHAEAYGGDVRAKAEEQLRDIESTAAHLRQLVAGMTVLGSLAEWIERPQKSFSYGQPDGRLFDAILEQARSSAALPQSARPEMVGIRHPGHAAPRGPLREEYRPFN